MKSLTQLQPESGARVRVAVALLLVAVDLAVFLRWQRGLYNHVDNGANLFLVGSMVWALMVVPLLCAVVWLMRGAGHRWMPVLTLLACALVSHAVVPASLVGVAAQRASAPNCRRDAKQGQRCT